MPKTKLFIIMGVSGTGKTTVGKLLSKALGIPFYDGDDYHPKANIIKMASGQPLDDNDRGGWLKALNSLLKSNEMSGAIVACSALKQQYRDILKKELQNKFCLVYLQGSFEEVKSRLEQRRGHFMPLELLQSQFDTLEPPIEAITIPIDHTPEEIVQTILKNNP